MNYNENVRFGTDEYSRAASNSIKIPFTKQRAFDDINDVLLVMYSSYGVCNSLFIHSFKLFCQSFSCTPNTD